MTAAAGRAALAGLALLLCGYAWFVAASLWRGAPLLLDFSVFWAAGRLAWHGQAALAYDWRQFDAALVFLGPRPAAEVGPWFYPPMFFLVVAPFALLPLATAAAAWLAATAAALLAAVRAILPVPAALLATLAAPPVFFNICSGQNGLLSAALFGGGLALIDRRPLAGGALLGALVYKPQFAIVLPLVLAVAGRWRGLAGAVAGAIATAAVAGALFGWDTFPAFLDALFVARQHLLAGGERWDRLESVYGMLRTSGLGASAAWLVHGGVALAALAATCTIWRRPAPSALKAASLSLAAFLATPYSEASDLALLLVPMAFLVRDGGERGFQPWEPPLLGLVFFAPLLFLFLPPLRTLSGLGPSMGAALAGILGLRLGAAPRRFAPAT